MDKSNLKVRVIPNYQIDGAMLSSDGFTLTKQALIGYLEHIATQVTDIIAYFEHREQDSSEVSLEEASGSGQGEVGEDLVASNGTRQNVCFDSSFTLPEAYQTPTASTIPRSSVAGVINVKVLSNT